MLSLAPQHEPTAEEEMRARIAKRATILKQAADLAAMAARGEDPALGLQYLLDAADDALVDLCPLRCS